MVETQLVGRGIADRHVLKAMGKIPREEFVPDNLRVSAYQDSALPIGHGQTISQPYTVAFMCQALALKGSEKILDVGTGSGYAAAVLSQLAAQVYSVERIDKLAELAKANLKRVGLEKVQVSVADGTLGLSREAPFDAIVVAATAEQLPRPLLEQLSEGGRIVIPLGDTSRGQRMHRITLREGKICDEDLGGFAFVPLVGEHGW